MLEDLLSEKVFPLDITPLVGVEDEGKIWDTWSKDVFLLNFGCKVATSQTFKTAVHRNTVFTSRIQTRACKVVCGNRRLYVLREYSEKVRNANGEIFIPIYVHKKSSSDPLPASLFAKYVEASSTRTGGGWPSFYSNRSPWDCKKTDLTDSWRT